MEPQKIQGVSAALPRLGSHTQTAGGGAQGFHKIFEAETAKQEIKFSAHAMNRLRMAGKTLTNDDYIRLHKGIEKAADKGAKDAVILMDDTAYIVNIHNRTVVTAVDKARLKDSVFTNIDSMVLI